MQQPEVRAERNEAHDRVLLEGFIPGREFALEGMLHHGALFVLALFDKPDPLDGPFFEETIYVTPSSAPPETQRAIVDGVAARRRALGLHHGPVHAECRVNARGVYVLEVAARPIGGLCARALRSVSPARRDHRSLEELLLRHALGEDPAPYHARAARVRRDDDPDSRSAASSAASTASTRRAASPGIDEIHITAKPDQRLVPLPEGASYLGFIFARAATPALVEQALRVAHARLVFTIEAELPVLALGRIHYNLPHG